MGVHVGTVSSPMDPMGWIVSSIGRFFLESLALQVCFFNQVKTQKMPCSLKQVHPSSSHNHGSMENGPSL